MTKVKVKKVLLLFVVLIFLGVFLLNLPGAARTVGGILSITTLLAMAAFSIYKRISERRQL